MAERRVLRRSWRAAAAASGRGSVDQHWISKVPPTVREASGSTRIAPQPIGLAVAASLADGKATLGTVAAKYSSTRNQCDSLASPFVVRLLPKTTP